MNLAIRIAAAILSVPPDVLAPMVPPMAPRPRNALESQLRNEVDSALSGSCSSASADAPLFAISREEARHVDCKSGMPAFMERSLYDGDEEDDDGDAARPAPSTYGEITVLGTRQLFYHMGLTKRDAAAAAAHRFVDLGSGGGRLVIQAHLELPSVATSVGIELSPSRHAVALETWRELARSGEAGRIRRLAERSWGVTSEARTASTVQLHEGDLFELDLAGATHVYVASLCFTPEMLARLLDKLEREGISLQVVATLKPFPRQDARAQRDGGQDGRTRLIELAPDPRIEYVEMSWTKARGDGCPVYFYTTNAAREY